MKKSSREEEEVLFMARWLGWAVGGAVVVSSDDDDDVDDHWPAAGGRCVFYSFKQ